MPWFRSDSIPFPNVWRRFETISKDGRKLKFRIQDATLDMADIIEKHMISCFLKEEPISKCLDVVNDEQSMNDSKSFWKHELEERAFLVCLEEDRNDGEPDRLVALNLTGVRIQESPFCFPMTGVSAATTHKILSHMMLVHAKLYDHFKIDRYLSATGLSVDPAYRGMGIGVQLLNARTEICQALDLPLTGNAFSSKAGQRVGEKAGYIVHCVKTYTDLEKELDISLPGIEHDCIKVMYKIIDSNLKLHK